MQTVNIATICHPTGEFSVSKDMGTAQGIERFATPEEADAHAQQLQAQAGGPDKAKITVHDLTKKGGA